MAWSISLDLFSPWFNDCKYSECSWLIRGNFSNKYLFRNLFVERLMWNINRIHLFAVFSCTIHHMHRVFTLNCTNWKMTSICNYSTEETHQMSIRYQWKFQCGVNCSIKQFKSIFSEIIPTRTFDDECQSQLPFFLNILEGNEFYISNECKNLFFSPPKFYFSISNV